MTFLVASTKVRVDFLFLILLAILFSIGAAEELTLALSFSLLHEIGHLLAMILCSAVPKVVAFTPFGIRIEQKNNVFLSYPRKMFILVAGCLVNLICGTIAYLGNQQEIALINLTIAAFNLIPAAYLDGGQMLFLTLQHLIRHEKAAVWIHNIVSLIILIPLSAAAFLIMIRTGYQFTLFFTCTYLIVTLLLKPGLIE